MPRRAVGALASGGNAVPRLELNRSVLLGAQLALLAIAYYFAVRLGFGLRLQGAQVGITWPANALLLGALVLAPKRRWWLVLIATALAHTAALGLAVPGWRLLWQIAGNAVFVPATAEILGRIAGLPLHFGNRRQVVGYVIISLASPLLFTLTAPAFIRSLLHLEPAFTPSTALLRLTLSNATALLLVTPVVVLWSKYGVKWIVQMSARRLCEAATIAISLLVVGFFAFDTESATVLSPALLVCFFPPLLWAAVRFGPIGASAALFSVAAMSIWGTTRHLGPFVLTTNADTVFALQVFWIALCIPVMLLAGVIREREEVEQRLRESQQELNQDYKRVSDLARRLMGAQEDERKRIAGQLHDDVSQQLALQIAALESELVASSLQLRRFLEAVPTGLVRCSHDLRYLSANSAYCAITGLPADQIVGRRIVDVIGPDAWETIRPHIERVRNGERVEFETLVRYAAAGPRQVHVVGMPEKEGKEVVGWVGSVTDITEFKRVEKQLQEVEKIAAAGQLAASLAHEINNPLSAVINVLYLLGHRIDLDPTAAGLISSANNEIARVARIVKQSLSYYRAGVARQVDLAGLMEESLQVFNDKLQRAGITISKRSTPGTSIIGFADEIRQVVDNLLVNAAEAAPRGRLTLSLRPSRSWKDRDVLGARLTVADNGSGIPKAYLARVFEPFFTTKAEKGTGLGLWVVKGLVEKHGGHIKLRSSDAATRSGTVISIFWPSTAEVHLASKLSQSEYAA